MIKICRIGHATFETTDVGRSVDYYTSFVGLHKAHQDKDGVHLNSQLGAEALHIRSGGSDGCVAVSWEVSPQTDLDSVRAALSEQGVQAEFCTDVSAAISRSLRFNDPNGLQLDLFQNGTYAGTDSPVVGVAPLKFGHIAFESPDVKKSADFYCNLLGFKVSDWMEDHFVFMRCGPDHHTVNFVQSSRSKLHHIAFELKDWAHIQHACELLGQRNIPLAWGPGRHGIGHNLFIYHRNPDDQIVEFFAELDQLNSEELGYFEPRPWHRDRPQYPKTWTRQDASLTWGPPRTPEYMRGRD